MRFQHCILLAVPVLLSAGAAARPAWADVGFQAGPRVGLELAEDKELSLGGDVRLSFSLSPLTVSLAIDYYFFQDRTLFQISANPLYDLFTIGGGFLFGSGKVDRSRGRATTPDR